VLREEGGEIDRSTLWEDDEREWGRGMKDEERLTSRKLVLPDILE